MAAFAAVSWGLSCMNSVARDEKVIGNKEQEARQVWLKPSNRARRAASHWIDLGM